MSYGLGKVSCGYLLLFAFVGHLFMRNLVANEWPSCGVLPRLPKTQEMELLALGDKEFLFRYFTLSLQNAGDLCGKTTPLNQYDYALLHRWFLTLDELNHTSNWQPFLAAYNYSLSQNPKDAKIMVDYLRKHAKKLPQNKWRWLAHAVYIAKHRAKDLDLALEVALELSNLDEPNVPLWARQLSAFVSKEKGDFSLAKKIMLGILATDKNISENESRFMQDYVNQNLPK